MGGVFTITSNIKDVKDDFLRVMREVKKADENFLPKEKPRIERHTNKIVESTVYKVPFKPLYYERTGNLLKSMSVFFPNPADKKMLTINSNPSIAPSLGDNRYSYANYVAGEPSIGFLKVVYNNPKSNKGRKSYFPRQWHNNILVKNSNYYRGGLEYSLTERYEKTVLKRLEKL